MLDLYKSVMWGHTYTRRARDMRRAAERQDNARAAISAEGADARGSG